MSKLEARLQSLNQEKIDLGLDRLNEVLERLALSLPETIITVGGTNGKGSVVAALSALVSSTGTSFGAFTSPHIHRFNERISVNGQSATDEDILSAFDRIDQVRHDIHLSYFEYALLAALLVFVRHGLEVIILEVGLGGRLDATNVLDADAAIITTVDLDHMDWLGDDIEQIAAEKAGIIRPDQQVVYGGQDVPHNILAKVAETGAHFFSPGRGFDIQSDPSGFSYLSEQHNFHNLPRPALSGDWQIDNFAAALTALLSLGWLFSAEQLNQALKRMSVPGRLQTIQQAPLVLADVAHNRQSATKLAEWLNNNPVAGHTRAVFSVLHDKQMAQWIEAFAEVVDHWFIFELSTPRALSLTELKDQLTTQVTLISQWKSGPEAYQRAVEVSQPDDRVVVFGSFHVLDEVFRDQQVIFSP
ncbi:bifunctional folylpolyglutamate synthase/dihydrofolate synthase [Marinicella sediminis]|uniref:Dihydrofolate synthase/folylpolyglutamate synthase n=1 Tax=Marinicella sediminis TaxID=1792834 RepID=A0ABV7J9N8_9GAMM|nr:folylpolyglutamate synthase/dihydrofolate synthase family protein [Marinicella sediminis]